jgi:hypothetical protein
MAETPFDSIESAQEYVRLLVREVEDVRAEIQRDILAATRDEAARRLDALQLVDYKLKQLTQHLGASSRILNDLRILRRLLVGESEVAAASPSGSEATGSRRS